MPSNKPRLYVALYVRGGAPKMPGLEDTYHWALFVGPKIENPNDKGKRYDAREHIGANGQSEWQYEERDIDLHSSNMQLIRVLVAKVEDHNLLERVLRSIPIRQYDPNWNCVEWIREALAALNQSKAIGTSVTEWQKVRDACMSYVQKKKDEHRFDGRGNFDMSKSATYNLLERVEVQV